MHFWPQSGTLSEDNAGGGAAAPQGGGGTSGGGNGSIFSSGAGMPAVNAGEIMLSRAESAALAALETEPDEKHGVRRARQESGLTDSQIKMLQRRAKHALSKGITLKGQGFVRKPTGGPPEEPSLLRKSKAESKEATEALREQYQRTYVYGLPEDSDFKFPQPHSGGHPDDIDSVRTLSHTQLPKKAKPGEVEEAEEANSITTMGNLVAAHRRIVRQRRS